MMVLVMGVAGSGKTTVGQRLAAELGWSFADADDFHSAENIAKMSAGVPLTDADREPWLAALRRWIDDRLGRGENVVVACSALKASYRAALIGNPREVRVVHLAASRPLIKARLARRAGHFMPPALADSQYAALEAPKDALTLEAAQPAAVLVGEIRRAFGI
jgi:gluconokinase